MQFIKTFISVCYFTPSCSSCVTQIIKKIFCRKIFLNVSQAYFVIYWVTQFNDCSPLDKLVQLKGKTNWPDSNNKSASFKWHKLGFLVGGGNPGIPVITNQESSLTRKPEKCRPCQKYFWPVWQPDSQFAQCECVFPRPKLSQIDSI